jgi:hypothetical protein
MGLYGARQMGRLFSYQSLDDTRFIEAGKNHHLFFALELGIKAMRLPI